VTLVHLLTWVANLFVAHGARHPGFGAVSHHLGWVMTRHWIVKICYRGSMGCGL